MNREELIKCAKFEKCRRNFWFYCKTLSPKFYSEDKIYLKKLCNELQEFYEDDTEFLSINLPPRHGKSYTAMLFTSWIFGKNTNEKIMTASYNQDLSRNFSKSVRDMIATEKIDSKRIVYNDVFPKTLIKYGDAQADRWSLEGSSCANYLATSPNGSATGFGCTVMIIDDLIKNAYEARNIKILNNHWEWFTNTMLSRREGKRKVILIMTRWSDKDLSGRAIKHFMDLGVKMKVVKMSAEQEDGTMLCDDVLDKKTCENLKYTLGEDIFEANYNQRTIDKKGCLYNSFLTYNNLPTEIESINNYTDTADTGSDYLCSITYAVSKGKYYVLNVIYTKEPMEVTEELIAKELLNNKVNRWYVESNNGGRGFGRNVMRITKELGNRRTIIKPFTQTKNKVARILTGCTEVMNCIVYPDDWKRKFPKFYIDVTEYQREGENLHDDSVDVLTGIIEKETSSKGWGWNV